MLHAYTYTNDDKAVKMEKQSEEGISHHTHGHFVFRSKGSGKEALSTASSRTRTWRGDGLDGMPIASDCRLVEGSQRLYIEHNHAHH